MPLETEFVADPGPEAVEFALTVTNADTEPVDVTYRSGLHADFAVREDDREVWRWSDGRMFTQAIETETLAPGESVRYAARWENPSPGEYAAVASLEATDADVAARAEFVV